MVSYFRCLQCARLEGLGLLISLPRLQPLKVTCSGVNRFRVRDTPLPRQVNRPLRQQGAMHDINRRHDGARVNEIAMDSLMASASV